MGFKRRKVRRLSKKKKKRGEKKEKGMADVKVGEREESAFRASLGGLLPPSHLVLSEELDVVAAVGQLRVLLHGQHVVSVITLYSTCR